MSLAGAAIWSLLLPGRASLAPLMFLWWNKTRWLLAFDLLYTLCDSTLNTPKTALHAHIGYMFLLQNKAFDCAFQHSKMYTTSVSSHTSPQRCVRCVVSQLCPTFFSSFWTAVSTEFETNYFIALSPQLPRSLKDKYFSPSASSVLEIHGCWQGKLLSKQDISQCCQNVLAPFSYNQTG